MILFFGIGCKKQGQVYDEVDGFNKVLTKIGDGKTKAYDLRHYDDCISGRIPGFYCMRTIFNEQERSIEELASSLILILGKKYNFCIILIDYDGTDSLEFKDIMNKAGFYNIHYFASGYQVYVELMGEEFIPATGECDGC